MIRWYALYTHPRSEKKLAKDMDKLGIEYYLPLLRTRKKWSDRYKWIEEPLFASYIFTHIEFERDSLRVLRLPHAVYFVSTNGTPTVVEENDLELLRLAVENYADSLVIRDTAALSTGQVVRVSGGPFAGKEAVIERIQGKTVVVVSFPALSKSVQVEIAAEMLTPIAPM